jgi:Lar family restriction alleviation protein
MLKPCPHCAGPHVLSVDATARRQAIVWCASLDCGAEVHAPTLAEAIERWNRRVEP